MAPADLTRRATWMDFLALEDQALMAECEFDRFRARGPGGQKRNVSDSAVRLRHRLSGLSVQATESRSQHENRTRALLRLRRAIAFKVRAPVKVNDYQMPTPLSAVVDSRQGIVIGRRDSNFLPTIACLFDLLEAIQWRVSDAARLLGISTAALVRFLALDVEVFRIANEHRRTLGLRNLRLTR